MEICQKIWLLKPRLSQSIKDTGPDTDESATYDFPLLFHSDCEPISYRFRDKWHCLPNFLASVHLTHPGMGFPLEFCNSGRSPKTRMMPNLKVKTCDDTSIRFKQYLHRTDSRTDRQTELVITISRSACVRMLTRDTTSIDDLTHSPSPKWPILCLSETLNSTVPYRAWRTDLHGRGLQRSSLGCG